MADVTVKKSPVRVDDLLGAGNVELGEQISSGLDSAVIRRNRPDLPVQVRA
jgi:hypothetical protein